MTEPDLTPRQIVEALDRHIVGQRDAKRAVAVALRNRWRRRQLPPELRDEISPKNIILIGPTGVGKTEIARRLARLARAPFVKVEASKFTEVGYVGRDVESMIRDLVEVAIRLVRAEHVERVRERAQWEADRRLARMLLERQGPRTSSGPAQSGPGQPPVPPGIFFVGPGGAAVRQAPGDGGMDAGPTDAEVEALAARIAAGELDDEEVQVEVEAGFNPFMTVFTPQGMEEMELNLREMFSQLPGFGGARRRQRRLPVAEARKVLAEQEAGRLVDEEGIRREAIERAEQSGIVFLDEIDKVAGRQQGGSGPDVSREGVQRDLLPIVEGSTVNTKHGPVRTDHVLFIAAGAFHVARVSELIPELQGRFPIRVELKPLGKDDFVRILTEPQGALTRQYQALLGTEGVELHFTDEAIEALAEVAAEANERAENIGARRLHTVLEALLEDISFEAPERRGERIEVTAAMVRERLEPMLGERDEARFIL